MPGSRLFLALFLVLYASIGLAQVDTLPRNKGNDKIRFSTIPNSKQPSLEPYYKALKEAEYGFQRFSIIEQLANHHIAKGNSDSIVQYGNQYVRELRSWDKPAHEISHQEAKAYYILGIGSKFNGLLDNALKWHIKGITSAETGKNPQFLLRNKMALAHIYNLQGTPEKGLELLKPLIVEIGNKWPEHTPEAFTIMGDSHYSLKEYAKAKAYYNKGLDNSKRQQNVRQELVLTLKVGNLAELEGRMNDAFELYNHAREKGLDKGYHPLYFEGTIRIGQLFFEQGNYDAATAALSIAYVNAIERENLHYQAEILDIQRKAFRAEGDYENAYAVMTQLAGVKNRISKQQQGRVSKELEIQYETLQKEKEILKLREDQLKREGELKRQRTIKNAFLIGFLIILIPIIALLYTYYQKIQAQSELAQKQKEISAQKLAALKQEQELDLVKATLDGQNEERKRIAQELHDSIGGNLAGIKLQLASLDKGSQKLKKVVLHLDETYELVRDISHSLIPKKFSENDLTTLVHEHLGAVNNLGKLEIGFYPHPKKAINALPEKVKMELFKIIQELTTNTLKHANAKNADIHLNYLDGELSLLFEDNGNGFDPSSEYNGIGFTNIKNRISQLGGSFHIDSVKNRGTVISVEIPINHNDHVI